MTHAAPASNGRSRRLPRWAVIIAVVCLAILAGSVVITRALSKPSWYTNGYNYAVASYEASDSPVDLYGGGTEYLACRYVVLNDIPRSGDGTDTVGIAYNAPSVQDTNSDYLSWINGCIAGLKHVGQ